MTAFCEDGVRSANDLGDGLNIVAHGRGGFRGLGVDHLVLRLERFFHFGEVEGLPVGGGEHVDFAAEGLGQSGPALAEFTGSEHQDAVAGRGEIGDRGLHGAGAGTRKDDHVVPGADKVFQLREHAGVEGAKLGSAMVNISRGHGELGGRQQGRWAWSVKSGLPDHSCIVSSLARRRAKSRLPARVG